MTDLLLATGGLTKILNAGVQGAAQSALNPVNALSSGVGSVANSASNYLGGGIIHSIESAIKSALQSSISEIGKALVDVTKLNLGNSFMSVYDASLEITAILAVVVLVAGAIRGAFQGNTSHIFQTVVRVMVAIIGSFLLVALIPYVQSAFGAFSNIFATSFGSNIAGFGTKLETLILTSNFITGAPMTFIILGVLILMANFTTLVVLSLSGMVAYIAAIAAPFAFLISPKSARKLLEILIVALATPTIITAIFALGLAVFSASIPTASAWIGSTIEGLGIMLLAVFSPLGVMKLLPMGEEAIAKMGAHHQQIKSAVSEQAVWGYKSAKDIATMANPALEEAKAYLAKLGSTNTSGTDTSAIDNTQSKPLNTGLDEQSGNSSTPGSTGNNQTKGSTPNTPNDLGNNSQDSQDPPDSSQPPPPQNPKE